MAPRAKKNDTASKKPGKSASDPVLEITLPEGLASVMTPLAILLGSIIVSVSVVYAGSKLTIEGTTLGATEETTDDSDTETQDTAAAPAVEPVGDVVRDFETFTEYDTDICKKDGKPVIYLFSTTWCPHCEWIKDTFDSWAKDNAGKAVVYHWELDTNDNTLTSEVETEIPAEHNEIYEQFNPNGSIPTFVFGCRYGRVGNGYESQDDLDAERDSFDAVLQELI